MNLNEGFVVKRGNNLRIRVSSSGSPNGHSSVGSNWALQIYLKRRSGTQFLVKIQASVFADKIREFWD